MTSLPGIVERVRRWTYTDRVRAVVEQTGLKPYISRAYYKSLYFASDETRQMSLLDATAEFDISNQKEFFAHLQNETSERAVLTDLLQELRPQDVFYDVGANVGIYSILAADLLTEGAVISFEPHPANAERIRVNAAHNDRDVTVLEYALSDESGTAEFVREADQPGIVNSHLATNTEMETIQVKTARGDEIFRSMEFPPPSVIKIDVEGAEAKVVDGFESALTEHCRLCYCEIHQSAIREYGSSTEEVISTLEEFGFTITQLDTRKLPHSEDDIFIKAVHNQRP